jgi:hypothetical protein
MRYRIRHGVRDEIRVFLEDLIVLLETINIETADIENYSFDKDLMIYSECVPSILDEQMEQIKNKHEDIFKMLRINKCNYRITSGRFKDYRLYNVVYNNMCFDSFDLYLCKTDRYHLESFFVITLLAIIYAMVYL